MPTSPVHGPLCTRRSLTDDLRRLGVQRGDILLVHSSLRALGWVCGGAEAVVLALQDAIGDPGTLVVPSHSGDNSDPAYWENPPVPEEWFSIIRASVPPYDPRTTRTRGMGVIADTVRTWPGAVRSCHPQTSFAAVGPHASHLMARHALDCGLGEQSPLARLEEAHARVLLLGVGFESCTAFHLAEYRLPTTMKVDNSFAVTTKHGREWMTVRDVRYSNERFKDIGAAYEKARPVLQGKVGGAPARLFPLADAVAYAQEWLPPNRPTG